MAWRRSAEELPITPNSFDSQYPCSAEVLPVTPDGLHPRWLDLQQSQLFRSLSYNFSWRALRATTFREVHRQGFFIFTQVLLAVCSMTYVVVISIKCLDNLCVCYSVWLLTCMVDYLCGLSTRRENILLWYLFADHPLVEIWDLKLELWRCE